MTNPWDVPPWPEGSDEDSSTLYHSVGRALTQWEEAESTLASLFSYLVSPHMKSLAAERAYGTIATFRGRLEMLEAAAGVYFDAYKVRARLRSGFKPLMTKCRGLAARRNEIAHGTVIVYKHLWYLLDGVPSDYPKDMSGFCLVPPDYNSNKTSALGRPKYVYSSDLIDGFAKHFEDLAIEVRSLEAALHRVRPARPKYTC